jgi:alkane 1-monooxygenase
MGFKPIPKESRPQLTKPPLNQTQHINYLNYNMKDIKYVSAYSVPLMTWAGLAWGGYWSWMTVIVVFGLIPVVEQWLHKSDVNVPESEEAERSERPIFDWLLYLNVPLTWGTTLWYCYWVAQGDWTWVTLVGCTLGVGIVVGGNGINVAHELGHRSKVSEQLLAKILLLPALYQHFFIEHNWGHHKHVATPADPASAAKGQNVYAFWVQSIVGSWRSGWEIEAMRRQQAGHAVWSFRNEMLIYLACYVAWLSGIGWWLGGWAMLGAFVVALIGVLLLETINYIEHYGLRRKQLASGRYEPVTPAHSWNSDHELGRILLYELTRHSDHHYKATRKFQILRHIDESPQLPLGYPGSMLLSLVPPAWFWVMDREVDRFYQQHITMV